MFIFGALRSLPRRSSWNNKRLRYIDATDTPPRGFRAKRTKIKHLAISWSFLGRASETVRRYPFLPCVRPTPRPLPRPPCLSLTVRSAGNADYPFTIAAPLATDAHGRISRLPFTMIVGSSGFPGAFGKSGRRKAPLS